MWMVQKTIIIIEQGYINIGCDDDDDDGGCGESFFFTLLSSKENSWWFSSRFIQWLALIWDEQNVRSNTC